MRTHELNEKNTVDVDSYLLNDKSSWGTALKLKLSTLISYISGLYTTITGSIKTACGLSESYTYVPPVNAHYVTTNAFTAATLTPSLNNADLLLDTQINNIWSALGGGSAVASRTFKISTASLFKLKSYPIDLITAPGANKLINIIRVTAYLDTAGVGNLDGNSNPYLLRFKTSTNTILEIPFSFYSSATDIVETFAPADDTELSINEGVELYCAADDVNEEGTYSLYINIVYNVLDFAVNEPMEYVAPLGA